MGGRRAPNHFAKFRVPSGWPRMPSALLPTLLSRLVAARSSHGARPLRTTTEQKRNRTFFYSVVLPTKLETQGSGVSEVSPQLPSYLFKDCTMYKALGTSFKRKVNISYRAVRLCLFFTNKGPQNRGKPNNGKALQELPFRVVSGRLSCIERFVNLNL